MEQILEHTNRRKNVIICGDFIVDMIKNSKQRLAFTNLLNLFNFRITITEPTHITSTAKSCLDNIVRNFHVYNYLTTNIHVDFSDHTA